MKVDLHTSPTVFDELAGEWDSLLDPSRSQQFFMRLDWQRTWWKHIHRGRQLAVLTIRDADGKLSGIAPCFVDENGQGQPALWLVGCTDITDYVDFICRPGQEELVLDAVLAFLASDQTLEWDAFHICSIPQASATLALLPRLIQKHGFTLEMAIEDVCPVITLPDNYQSYLDMLDKKQRHELRRKRRKAEVYPVEWYVVGPNHDIHQEIENFLELMSLATTPKANFLKEPGHRDFFRDIGELAFNQGMLDLTFLVIEGRRAAAIWSFMYGNRMMLYNSGLRTEEFMALSPGVVLLTFHIESAIQRGFAIYDFLQGGEEYKYRMGAKPTIVNKLSIYR